MTSNDKVCSKILHINDSFTEANMDAWYKYDYLVQTMDTL